MRAFCCGLILLAACTVAAAAGKGPNPATPTTKAKRARKAGPATPARLRRFLFLAQKRPVLFGVRMQLDGHNLHDYYQTGIAESYKYADTNTDNKISAAEFAQVPWRPLQRQRRKSFLLSFLGGNKRPPKNATGKKKFVSRPQFIAAYAKRHPQLALVPANPSNLTQAKPLFEFADQDGNGELSKNELASLLARWPQEGGGGG